MEDRTIFAGFRNEGVPLLGTNGKVRASAKDHYQAGHRAAPVKISHRVPAQAVVVQNDYSSPIKPGVNPAATARDRPRRIGQPFADGPILDLKRRSETV
jgi:hypothetical protein